MAIDWVTIITTLLSLIFGGGLVGLFTLRQTKQGLALDNAAKVVEKYESLVERYGAERDAAINALEVFKRETDERITSMVESQHELKRQLSVAQTQIANLQLLYTSANTLRCNNLNCEHRTPPLDLEQAKKILCDNDNNEE